MLGLDSRAAKGLMLGFLIGGVVVALMLALVGIDRGALPLFWKASRPGPGPAKPGSGLQSPPGGRVSAQDEQLRELQDAALQTLAGSPNDEKALRRLVAVRRKLARDNVATLRRQAEAYRQAVADGRSLEYYAPAALAFLAAADELAADEIERERGR
jgi:hypothetical protein